MYLYYAVGSGLGHLTRALAFIHTMKLEEVKIMTAHPQAKEYIDQAQLINIPAHFAQKGQRLPYQKWLTRQLQEHQIQHIFLDAFPIGIVGEWLPFIQAGQYHFEYIARVLKMEVYQQYLPKLPIQLEKTYVLESLSIKHKKWIQQNSLIQIPIQLKYPEIYHQKSQASLAKLEIDWAKTWLVVHSDQEEEVAALVQYALDKAVLELEHPDVLVITNIPFQHQNPNVRILSFFPAYLLFPKVAKIFTAAGFNSIQQTAPFSTKHVILPLMRKFDDQFRRLMHK